MDRILLFGGGFDPIHNAHLRLAKHASIALGADVFLIPNRTPPWKTPHTTASQRLEMIKRALDEINDPRLHLSTYEIDSAAEVNYSIDTVRHFKKTYPDKELYLLIGTDAANLFDKWKEPDEIASLAHIIVIPRPGIELDKAMEERFRMRKLDYEGSGDASSTGIRNLTHGDIPVSVRDYIEENGLYYMKELSERYSPKRLAHVVSVAKLAYSIAVINGIDQPYRYYIAGLLHDIAKKCDHEKARKIMKREYKRYADMPKWTYHQFVGKTIARDDFGIVDEGILDAIACHATGKDNMSPLEMTIYASDKIDPLRGYDSSGYIKACKEDYENGFKIVLKANKEFYHEKGYPFEDNELTAACVKQYLGDKD